MYSGLESDFQPSMPWADASETERFWKVAQNPLQGPDLGNRKG